MKWELKGTNGNGSGVNKSLYISESLVEKINEIAYVNNTSFDNVVISMIESCLNYKSGAKGYKRARKTSNING